MCFIWFEGGLVTASSNSNNYIEAPSLQSQRNVTNEYFVPLENLLRIFLWTSIVKDWHDQLLQTSQLIDLYVAEITCSLTQTFILHSNHFFNKLFEWIGSRREQKRDSHVENNSLTWKFNLEFNGIVFRNRGTANYSVQLINSMGLS